MTGETRITIVGNLVRDPELRYTQGGLAVTGFTIASTNRVFDRQANDWKDGDPLFLRASAWRELGENVSKTLTQGTRVIATGVLKQRSWEDKDGNKRTEIELEVEEIGPSLRYAIAQIQRAGGDQRTLAQERPVRSAPREDARPASNARQQPVVQDDYWANDETPF